MDADDLAMLDTIITEGGVTGASRRLGLPKATVSRRLQRLEQAFGTALFDRSGRRLRLTQAGMAAAGPAQAIRVALTTAQALVQDTGRGFALRVVTPFVFGRRVVVPCMGRFLAGTPGVTGSVHFDNSPRDPLRDGLDIAIRVQPPSEPYLTVVRLTEADLRLYADPVLAGRIGGLADLAGMPAVNTANDDGPMVLHLAGGGAVYDVPMQVRARVNDPEAACELVAAGLGVGALPAFLADDLVRTGQLVPVLPGLRAGTVVIHAVMPPLRNAIPPVRSFLRDLRQTLVEQRFARA